MLKISRDNGVGLSIISCFGEMVVQLVRAAQRRKMSVFVFFIVWMGLFDVRHSIEAEQRKAAEDECPGMK